MFPYESFHPLNFLSKKSYGYEDAVVYREESKLQQYMFIKI